MGNEIAKALKRKVDNQFRVTGEDYTPSIVEQADGVAIYNAPADNILPYVAGKNVTIGTSGNNKVINALMNILAGANIGISDPDPTTGAVTVTAVLPEAYALPQATDLVLGGVMAKARLTEPIEVVIDTLTGILYASLNSGEVLPAPSVDYRGQVFTVLGGVGVADVAYVCLKDITDTYSWVAI